MKSIELTAKERETIMNFDKINVKKESSFLAVKSYLGKNSELKALNGTAKFIGTADFIHSENCWYVKAINGEKYRIPEPANGIDTVLDLEFKRKEKEKSGE
jgi:hypothetical protein